MVIVLHCCIDHFLQIHQNLAFPFSPFQSLFAYLLCVFAKVDLSYDDTWKEFE